MMFEEGFAGEGYGPLAYWYDFLTEDIDYPKRAAYFDSLNETGFADKGILLDLGCGTGKMSRAFAALGYSVIGVDCDEDMLSVARHHSDDDILYLCQDMRNLDLYGTVSVAVCALDGINHLLSEEDVLTAFKKISLFLEKGGYFIFDVNTPYKHREILKDNLFVLDYDDVYLVWENRLSAGDLVEMELTYFVPSKGGLYRRYRSLIYERAYPVEVIEKLLKRAGFQTLHIYEGDTKKPLDGHSQRAVFVAKKEK